MGFFNMFKKEKKLTSNDLINIRDIVASVGNELYEYSCQIPEIALDPQKIKLNASEAEKIALIKNLCINISAFYIATIEHIYKCSNNSNLLINYLSQEFSLFSKELIEKMKMAGRGDMSNFTYNTLKLNVSGNLNLILNSKLKDADIPLKLGSHILNNEINQKVSDYNIKVLLDGLNKVIDITQ